MMLNQKPSMHRAWEQAQMLLQAGKTADAEELLQDTLKNAVPESEPYFSGVEYLATVQLLGGIIERALETLKEGCARPEPADKEARKQRLTLLMNAGEIFQRHGQLAEAEEALRAGLAGRESFYGKTHAGFAFGLEPLGDVFLAQGKREEAARLYDAALKIFARERHPRAVGALARVLVCQKLATPTDNPYESASMPRDAWDELASASIGLTRQLPGGMAAPALWNLQSQLAIQLGEGHALREALLTLLSNEERKRGDWKEAKKAFQLLANLYHGANQPERMLEAMLGVALAQSESGDHNGAQKTYQDVIARAEKRGNPNLQARARAALEIFLQANG